MIERILASAKERRVRAGADSQMPRTVATSEELK
jgi:hypothetical protein